MALPVEGFGAGQVQSPNYLQDALGFEQLQQMRMEPEIQAERQRQKQLSSVSAAPGTESIWTRRDVPVATKMLQLREDTLRKMQAGEIPFLEGQRMIQAQDNAIKMYEKGSGRYGQFVEGFEQKAATDPKYRTVAGEVVSDLDQKSSILENVDQLQFNPQTGQYEIDGVSIMETVKVPSLSTQQPVSLEGIADVKQYVVKASGNRIYNAYRTDDGNRVPQRSKIRENAKLYIDAGIQSGDIAPLEGQAYEDLINGTTEMIAREMQQASRSDQDGGGFDFSFNGREYKPNGYRLVPEEISYGTDPSMQKYGELQGRQPGAIGPAQEPTGSAQVVQFIPTGSSRPIKNIRGLFTDESGNSQMQVLGIQPERIIKGPDGYYMTGRFDPDQGGYRTGTLKIQEGVNKKQIEESFLPKGFTIESLFESDSDVESIVDEVLNELN